ncbi:MAG: hypothetical protein K6L73_04025 [Cellvibrionaceae bacterium]
MKIFLTLIALIASQSALGTPSILVIDKKFKKEEPVLSELIKDAHTEIQHTQKNKESIRYAILQGMLSTKDYKWAYEEEGENFILARMDYKGNILIVRIEYSYTLVQLKFHLGTKGFKCKYLTEEGICHNNRKKYYAYIKHLRNSIARIITNM